jgi:hypothetical protein
MRHKKCEVGDLVYHYAGPGDYKLCMVISAHRNVYFKILVDEKTLTVHRSGIATSYEEIKANREAYARKIKMLINSKWDL